jgi:hypothetical protein
MAAPSDTALLLRVHHEQQWLHTELLPVLEQLEDPAWVESGDMGAALAYLEVTWDEALVRARETDAAYARLTGDDGWDPTTTVLVGEARRYYGWLRDMRRRLIGRVEAFLGSSQANGLAA